MSSILWLFRVVAVLALVCSAAALATPPGRLPLALRGLQRMLRRDAGLGAPAPSQPTASTGRRITAFILIIAAVLIAVV